MFYIVEYIIQTFYALVIAIDDQKVSTNTLQNWVSAASVVDAHKIRARIGHILYRSYCYVVIRKTIFLPYHCRCGYDAGTNNENLKIKL